MTTLSKAKDRLFSKILREKGIERGSASRPPVRGHHSPFAPAAINQEGLWFLDRMHPDQASYSMPGTVLLRGRLDMGALEFSLSEIGRRHEALRTTFSLDDGGQLCQIIGDPTRLEVPVTDLRTLPAADRHSESLRLAAREAKRPFDLEQGPLFRVRLVRLDEDQHVLMLNLHHIIADGWSIRVLNRELKELYTATIKNRVPTLPDLPVQYADFAVWQRQRMEGEGAASHADFWRKQLGGTTPVLELPTDRPKRGPVSYRGAHEPLRISPSLTRSLRAVAHSEGVTLFCVALAAFKTCLSCLSRQEDIIIGSTFANRTHAHFENLVGFFANTLPLRTDLSGDPSFRELIRRVQEVTLGVLSHQETPFLKLVRDLRPDRDQAAGNPFYQVVFDLLTPDYSPVVYGWGMSSTVEEEVRLPGLKITPMDVEGGVSRFDLSIFLWDMGESLDGVVEYSTDLFDAETIRQLSARFESVLRHVAAEPEVQLSAVHEKLRQADTHEQIRRAARHRETLRRKLQRIRHRSAGDRS